MPYNQIIEAARRAQLQLKSDGHDLEANSVQRLIVSRASLKALNKVLHGDLARCRDLLKRAASDLSDDPKFGYIAKAIDAEISGAAK